MVGCYASCFFRRAPVTDGYQQQSPAFARLCPFRRNRRMWLETDYRLPAACQHTEESPYPVMRSLFAKTCWHEICGAAGNRTPVQSKPLRTFYMLITLINFRAGPGSGAHRCSALSALSRPGVATIPEDQSIIDDASPAGQQTILKGDNGS